MPKRSRAAGATGPSGEGDPGVVTPVNSQQRRRAPPSPGTVPSGECVSGACACQSPAAAVDAALERVKCARAFGGSMPSRGPLNEEAVLRAICDDYISHSRAADDLKPKQVRLREALRRVAVKLHMPFLGTFNCKTTSLRTLGRALWEGCQLAKDPKDKAQALRLTQKNDGEIVDAVFQHLASLYKKPIPSPEPPLPNLLDMNARSAPQLELKKNGIVLLRGFVPEKTCEWLLSRACDHHRRHTPTWLTETMSLGRRGCYFDKHWNLPTLRHIQESVVGSLGLSHCESEEAPLIGADDAKLPAKNSKAVMLAYTEGAENWAHQDDNKEFAFQALLMLSQPGVDFTGGELYVLDGSSGWAKRCVSFARRGDVAVFRSNDLFFHGMDPVLPGATGPLCSRVAVGLFHKHT